MTFLENYVVCASGNEAPPLYHIWSGIAVLSAIISRRVRIEQGHFVYHPNMYVVLVGSPGGGKSTAMNIGKKMVREIKDIPLAATAITKEALVRFMSEEDSPCKKSFKRPDGSIEEYTPMTIFATELTHFMAVNPIGMIDFLTTIYDEPVYEVKTKHQGDDLMEGPYITMLACMTPEITTNFIKLNIISGGFARRANFVWASGRGEPEAWPIITPEQRAAWVACLEWAQKLKKVNGLFKWTPEARAWYEPWYVKLRKQILPSIKDPMLIGYYESKHVQLMKIAMLVALSESMDLTLEVRHLTTALALLGDTEKTLGRVFEGTGRNELSGVANKIVLMLEQIKQPVPRKQIVMAFYRDAKRDELDKILFHLVDSGKLIQTEDRRPNGTVTMLATPEAARRWAEQTGAKVLPLPPRLPNAEGQDGSLVIDLS